MAVTSNVGNRGRALGVVFALAMVGALLSAQTAFGAVDGDPIASSVFKVKLSSGFKKQLKHNGVKMKPKSLKLTKGDVDPLTGAADLTLGKITFKKGSKKVVYGDVKGSEPGTLKGSSGKLFKATAAKTVTRDGFGADVSGVKLKLLKSAVKKINKKLGLHSLHTGTAGNMTLSYQPQTVKILSGVATTTGALTAGSVPIKFLSHCVNGLAPNGITPIAPATQSGLTLTFPVTGGTISPAGNDGVVQQSGGVRIQKNVSSGGCATSGPGQLDQTEQAVNLGLLNVQSHAVIVEAPPGVSTGDKGIVIGQTIDPTGSVVTADPANHTIAVNGGLIKINALSAGLLNLIFPNTSGNSANDFADGDPFGTSTLNVTVR